MDDPFSHAVLKERAVIPGSTRDPWIAGQARNDGFAGLGKIAALGIKVSHHCTYHGVALNVAMDLEPFSRINPCGYAGLQTTDLRSLEVDASWDEAMSIFARKLAVHLEP